MHEKNIKGIIDVIYELIENKESIFHYATNGFNYAKHYHSKTNNSKKLISVLSNFSKMN